LSRSKPHKGKESLRLTSLPPSPPSLLLSPPTPIAITRDSRHKRRATGGRRHPHQKKRKFEVGRPPSMTKMGPKRIHLVRTRGGSLKHRAIRLETGNFSWGSEHVTKRTRILDVLYNASNNELVRTKTLVKNAVVSIDATPFLTYYKNHYRKTVVKQAKEGKDGLNYSVEDFVPEGASTGARISARYKERNEKLKVVSSGTCAALCGVPLF
jgi:small subunit ribosomal protein S8e